MLEAPMRHLVFIINPISGTGKQKEILRAIEKWVDRKKYTWDVRSTKGPGHAFELASSAAREGVYMAVAIGGDGSVNEVATGLLHSHTLLGIIPAGSGNGVARSLGLPMSARKAIGIINEHAVKTMDTGQVAGWRPFIGIAGLGFDAFIGKEFLHLEKRGLPSYIRTVAKAYGSYKCPIVRFSIDNGPVIEKRAFVICAANTPQYGNEAYIAPQAISDDGLLDFVVLEQFPRWLLPFLALRLFTMSILKSQYVHHYRGNELIIESDDHLLHVDGEPVEVGQYLKLQVVPNSLRAAVSL